MPDCETLVRNNWEQVVQDADEQGDVEAFQNRANDRSADRFLREDGD